MTRRALRALSGSVGLLTVLELSSCDSDLVTLGRIPGGMDSSSGTDTGGTASGGTDTGGTSTGGTNGVGADGGATDGGATDGGAAGEGGADGGATDTGGTSTGGASTGGRMSLGFSAVKHHDELGAMGFKDDNATLTANMLVVYFTSTRGENADVYRAERASIDLDFGEPDLFTFTQIDGNTSSPAISLDGRTLWVGQERDGGVGEIDVWVTTTTDGLDWSSLRNVTELNSPAKDIPRPPAGAGLVMPLGSQRAGIDLDYRTFLASRTSASGVFRMPQPIPELENGRRVVDGFLTEDLTMLFYSSGDGEDEGDLFVVRRATPSDPFGPPEPLTDLNTMEWDERDPWISPDLTRFFFTSNRTGDHEIFEATVTRQ
jgi:hypothetical protein